MTAEQLQHARASAWRHDGHALLTGDEAADWLRSASLALFLPRPAQIAAPAGSFVEATLGEANAAPSLHAIEAASGLLRRMLATASGAADAVALNLLGGPGDQPDFLATEETLPFVFALRGDREWRRGPRGKSSPLVTEVWKLLDRDGAHTADELKDKLGRHLTESAALRALTELWTTLRIEPIYSAGTEDGEATHWQLLEANHEQAMTAGSAMAQGMALSALVSVYLQSAIAATGEEIEAFLSPLASRSRVRDAVRGLHATRQLSVQHLGANEHFSVEGSLPDFGEAPARGLANPLPGMLADMLPETPEALAVAAGEEDESRAAEAGGGLRIDALSEVETERERAVGDGRKRFVAGRGAGSGDRKGFGPARGGSTGFGGPRRTFSGTGDGARKSFGAPGGSFSKRASSGPNAGPRPASRPGARPAPGADSRPGKPPATPPAKPFFAREPWKEDRRPGPGPDRQGGAGSERGESREEFRGKPRTERPAASAGGERRPFAAPSFRENREGREDASRKPFAPRGAGPGRAAPDGIVGGARPPRKTFAPRGDASGPARKPFTPRGDGDRPYPASYPPRDGDRKPFAAREGRPGSSGSDRKPFAPREGGKPFAPRNDRRPFAPQAGGRPSPGGDRKPFTPREDTRPFAPRDDRKAFAPREGGAGERKPYTPREGGRPFAPRSDQKPFAPREGGAPGRRTFGARPGAPTGAGERGGGFAPRDRSAGPRQNGPTQDGPRQDGPRQDSPRRFGAEGSAPPRRFATGEGRPSRPGAPAARPGGKRPRTAPFTSSGKPRTGVSATGRPGPRSASRSGPGAGARAGRPGKPASGRKPGAPPRKPGGKGPGKGPGTGPNRGPRRDG